MTEEGCHSHLTPCLRHWCRIVVYTDGKMHVAVLRPCMERMHSRIDNGVAVS